MRAAAGTYAGGVVGDVSDALARAEGSDNLDKAGAERLATEKAMRRRFHDYRTRYNERYP